MNKLYIYISVLCVFLLVAIADAAPRNNNINSPVGGSYTTPASSGGSGLYRSQTESSYRQRNLTIPSDLVRSGSRSELDYDAVNSYLRRFSGDPYGYDGTAGYRTHLKPSDITASNLQVGGLGFSRSRLAPLSGSDQTVGSTYKYYDQPAKLSRLRPFDDSTEQMEREMLLRINMLRLDEQAEKELLESKYFIDKKSELLDETPEDADRVDEKLLMPEKPVEPGKPIDLDELLKEMELLNKQSKEPVKAEDDTIVLPVEEGSEKAAEEEVKKVLEDERLASRTHKDAKAILGEHKSYKTFAQAKFDKYTTEAKEFMAQGKFYRANDSYRLAAIYDAKSPVIFEGRALALLGAGEYMTSVYFLERAIKADPIYAKLKVDLVAVLGDKDKLDDRLIDLGKWYEKNKAPELSLLMAYVYYNTDRLSDAQAAVEKAGSVVPDSHAVELLKEAIEKAAAAGK